MTAARHDTTRAAPADPGTARGGARRTRPPRRAMSAEATALLVELAQALARGAARPVRRPPGPP